MEPAVAGGYRRLRPALAMVELVVVAAAIAVLGGILVPAVGAARERARAIQCEANLRQLGQAMTAYAAANEGRYPPNLNSSSPGQYWFDKPRAGWYAGEDAVTRLGKPGGSVFACPGDEGGARSYSMNFWGSCAVDEIAPGSPPRGTLWGSTARDSSRLILVSESWSYGGSAATGWLAPATLGYAGESAGQRFGAGGGLAPPVPAGRWGMVNCELPFARHRGRVNIEYADGHVESASRDDLANPSTGASTGRACWFPGDAGE